MITEMIPSLYGETHQFIPAVVGKSAPVVQKIAAMKAIWAVEATLLAGIVGSASGGMDSLPRNGAGITLLAVTGLTHCQSDKDTFAITIIKTIGVFVVIGIYVTTGLV